MTRLQPVELSVLSRHDGIEQASVERFESLTTALVAAIRYERDYGACSFFEVEVIDLQTKAVEFYSQKIDG